LSTAPARSAADLLFRRRAGQLTATLTRILGIEHPDLVEDVVQDAFVTALRRWPTTGIPDDPGAWILMVARNRALDVLRRRGRWREKAEELERSILPGPLAPGPSAAAPPVYFSDEIADDELRLILAMCHPSLSRDARVALTLKSAGGFTTYEVARAFLTSKSTVAQRLVRAKRALSEGRVTLEMPAADELPARLDSVLEVIYLMFNEGYSATSSDHLVRAELCGEAIRLVELLASHPVVRGPRIEALAALFLFQAARLPGRTDRGGDLLPLDRQDRNVWDRRLLRRALEHHRRSARGAELSPYHLQAEIASCHALAPSFEETDWPRILDCYDALLEMDPSPVVTLNRAVAVAQTEGPEAGLEALSPVLDDPALASYDPLFAVRAELLARAGRPDAARDAIRKAIKLATSPPRREYYEGREREFGGASSGSL
jgi:RNA polymerase sigma-70 factor (ECF subfamily)